MSYFSKALLAFKAASEQQSFSLAAESLGVSQGAISQQISKLESELGFALFHRRGPQLDLTEKGWLVLNFAQRVLQMQDDLERDLYEQGHATFHGHLKIIATRTLLGSVVQPVLAPLWKKNPELSFEFITYEKQNISELLRTGQINYFIGNRVIEAVGISNYVLGHEEFVLVKGGGTNPPQKTYLEFHADSDYLASLLMREGEREPNVQKRYFPDLHSMLDGVRQGAGLAILPRHLLQKKSDFEIIDSWPEKRVPVVLNFLDQSHHSRLENAVTGLLTSQAGRYLS